MMLLKIACLCDSTKMKRSFCVRSILAFGIIIGLLLAPVSAPALAKSADMTMTSADMSGDMPCCPDAADHKIPQDGGCKDCPLMAICNVTTLQAVPATGLANFHPVFLAVISAADDRLADGLIGAPPTRPPRSLV